MVPSHKPLIWSLFAGGGTFAAFAAPVMILMTGLALPLGLLAPDTLSFEHMSALLGHPIAKGLIFFSIFLPAWHAAHRLRITAHDLGIRADGLVMVVCYGLAALATLAAGYYLLVI
ncbi:MAG: fumarate reductase subunit D [Rhodospirillales bacterium]|nr:fumarate reductase subunit D [Rhodospirillales bacterium]